VEFGTIEREIYVEASPEVVFDVVSSPDHSRRLRRVMARAMKGHPARVLVHPTRYSQYDAATWWQTRLGRRTALIELQKLLLDAVRHPRS